MRDVKASPQAEDPTGTSGLSSMVAGLLVSSAAALRARLPAATSRSGKLTAFAAGAVSVLSLAPFHIWPVLFFTLPVLVWLIDGAVAAAASKPAWRRVFPIGWWFGFGYFLFGLFWVGEAFLVEAEKYALLIPFAVTLLPAGLSFFYAGAAALAAPLWRPGIARVLVLAVALTLFEWLRGHVLTGLPWNILGYALAAPLTLMQSASLVGAYGLTLWVVLICAGPLVLLADAQEHGRGTTRAAGALLVAAVPLAAAWAYGTVRLNAAPPADVAGVRFRIVQPSVPQREKWKPENQGPIFRDHLDLSRRDASGRLDDLKGITHVVWPEAAMPFLPLEHADAMSAIGELLPPGTTLLSGALRLARGGPGDPATEAPAPTPSRRVFNSLIVFGDTGGPAAIYDKNHLVPFGEYLPLAYLWRYFGLRGLVEMRGAFAAGETPRKPLSLPGIPPIGALICYEAIFPGDVVQGGERPGFLLSITNDGWFGNTTGPRQHYHQARVRAVEEGLPLLRAANNGISAVIDADGRVLGALQMNSRGAIDTPLPGARPPTPYARYGDVMMLVNALLFLIAAQVLGRRRN